MAVIKLIPTKDSTINSQFDKNNGIDEILDIGVDDINHFVNRILLAFDSNEISNLKNLYTDSIQSLNLYLANADTLPSNYIIELYQLINSDWDNGVGSSTQDDINGIKWSSYLTNYDSTKTKLLEHQFSIYDDKDIKLSLSGSTTYSYMLSIKDDLTLSNSQTFGLKYYSKDTNTIYQPTIDFKFTDSTFDNTLSGSVITKENFTVSLKNNCSKLYSDSKYRINIGTRYTYPDRNFFKNSIFNQKKYLPNTAYYAIRDVHANYNVIDFDYIYTKISLDSNGNFFNIYTKNFETNRYYSVDIKVVLNGNEYIMKDTYIFKLHDK